METILITSHAMNCRIAAATIGLMASLSAECAEAPRTLSFDTLHGLDGESYVEICSPETGRNNEGISQILRDAALEAVVDYKPEIAGLFLYDVKTLSLTAATAFQRRKANTPLKKCSYSVDKSFKIGSAFKLATFALAIDSKKVSIHSPIDVSQAYDNGCVSIRDYYYRPDSLTVFDAFRNSSNIAAAYVFNKLGRSADKLKKLLPYIPDRDNDREPHVHCRQNVSIAIGKGAKISIQDAARAIAVLTSIQESLWPRDPILTHKTSSAVRTLMHEAAALNIPSSDNQLDFGAIATTNVLSDGVQVFFFAVFPIRSPQYVLAVHLEQPHPSSRSPGFNGSKWTAGVVGKSVIEKINALPESSQ